MSGHRCPSPGCAEHVEPHRLACRRHWYSLPKDLRDELWAAYRREGQGSERHMAAVQACCEFLEQAAAA